MNKLCCNVNPRVVCIFCLTKWCLECPREWVDKPEPCTHRGYIRVGQDGHWTSSYISWLQGVRDEL